MDRDGTSSPSRRNRRLRGLAGLGVLVLSASLTLAACGSSSSSAPLKSSQILSVDSLTRTVQLHLVGSETNAYGGFNFDGYSVGKLRVHVPLGWTVDVTCKNGSTVFTHSCSVIDDAPISPSGGQIAFDGASSPDQSSGLPCGSSASFGFVADRVGTYRIACLVSGHEADGMWDWLVVTPGGKPGLLT